MQNDARVIVIYLSIAAFAQSVLQEKPPLETPARSGYSSGIIRVTANNYAILQAKAMAVPPFENLNHALLLRIAALQRGDAEPYDFVDDMPAPWREKVMMNAQSAIGEVQQFPYDILIDTPYLRMLTIAREAKRRLEEPRFPSIEELTAGLPAVVLSPGTNFQTATSVENVVIRRGGTALKSAKSDLQPMTITDPAGNSRQVATGRFQFDYGAFDPSEPIEIVVIGPSTNRPWPMTRQELSLLR